MKRLFLLTASVVILASCGAGVGDYEAEILNGYFFADSGGDGKSITFHSDDLRGSRMVVGERVDQYRVVGVKILVTRRPRETFQVNGVTNSRLLDACEYWIIDTATNEISQSQKTSEWGDLKCYGIFRRAPG